jgi:hypothetical protein
MLNIFTNFLFIYLFLKNAKFPTPWRRIKQGNIFMPTALPLAEGHKYFPNHCTTLSRSMLQIIYEYIKIKHFYSVKKRKKKSVKQIVLPIPAGLLNC